MSWKMLPEWMPHQQTWMAWPCNPFVFELAGGQERAYAAWAGVANAVAAFEPVMMVVDPAHKTAAQKLLKSDLPITILEAPLGDSWMRDFGPTFVVDAQNRLGGVDWTFNGWGGRTFPDARADALIARFVCSQAKAERLPSLLVNEGGGIHVDGEGTLLVTETVQLNHNRNPNWSRQDVEAELNRQLGTEKVIWMPRGLLGDTDESGTDGHVDTLACFIKPGVVVVHGERDPAHPDYETAREIHDILAASTDAKGRKLEIITLYGPEKIHNDAYLPCSYVNFSFVNNGVVLCGFENPKTDTAMVELFSELFPERKIVQVPALDIFKSGGGVHCITQQQPLI